MITHSVMVRGLAIGILALIMLGAIVIAFLDLVEGRDIPPIVQTIIGIGLGTAGTIIGVNFGVVLQPANIDGVKANDNKVNP